MLFASTLENLQPYGDFLRAGDPGQDESYGNYVVFAQHMDSWFVLDLGVRDGSGDPTVVHHDPNDGLVLTSRESLRGLLATIVDDALTRIGAERRRRKPKDWIGPLSRRLRARGLDRLVRVGLLRREPQRVLWVFRRIRYPAASDAAAQVRSEIRRRLLEAVDTAEAVDQRTAALCALVRAMGVERLAVPDRSRRVVRARFKEVAAVSWPAEAVRKAIAEAEAAVAAAATAATVSAASAGTASQ